MLVHAERYNENPAGILIPPEPVEHRDAEFDSARFKVVQDMQSRHFWYLGRHRFILQGLKRTLRSSPCERKSGLSAVDLGGGCGGWVRYLQENAPDLFGELALADSSLRALELAADVMRPGVKRYQVDLLQLSWEERWDVAFLLDVLEHIPDDVEVMRQIARSLRPGGYLFVTTPAIPRFWTYNDDLAFHVRRYTRADFARLAGESGFELCLSRYFMFYLSPLLLLTRMKGPDVDRMSDEEKRELDHRTHQVPVAPVNQVLRFIFSLESPLGYWVPFPWGTSILGIFRKKE